MSSSLFLCNNHEPFLDRIVICDKKCILSNNWWWPSQWLDREEAPKYFPKPNLHQKRVIVTAWWSAASLIHYSFLNSMKPLYLRSMLSKLTRYTNCCNTCSWHWSTERAHFFSTTVPNCMLHNHCFKSWMNWATKFCLILYIHLTSCQLATASWSLLRAFCRERALTTSKRQKMLSKSSFNPEAQIFML